MSSDAQPSPVRLFLHEPGWQIVLKEGSDRAFCYMMSPGQDYYHRLHDGEIYLQRDDERLCTACALRRGLLSQEPRILPETYPALDLPGGGDVDAAEIPLSEDGPFGDE